MADYQAPLQDTNFVLHEVFEADKLWSTLNSVQDTVDRDTSDAILSEVAKLLEEVVAPLNREADEVGTSWSNGEVTAPPGFKEAYRSFCEGGWNGLSGNPDFGGMGMPKMLTAQVEEMTQSASMAFGPRTHAHHRRLPFNQCSCQ